MPVAPARYVSFAAGARAGRGAAFALRWLLILFWGAVTFALTFVELVAEIAGPLLLIGGAVWWLALQAVGGLTLEPELQQFLRFFPSTLQAGGHVFTPGGMIRDGLLLLALVAACRTVNGIIARES